MSARVYDLTARRWAGDPTSGEVVEIAMHEVANGASCADLIRVVARVTGIGECQLRRSWGGGNELWLAAIRRALTLTFG